MDEREIFTGYEVQGGIYRSAGRPAGAQMARIRERRGWGDA